MKREISTYSDQLAVTFGALGDRGRLKIFQLLLEHDNLCVTEIANLFGISVPAASQQLKIMEMSGLVGKERAGQMICYYINRSSPVVKSIQRIVSLKTN